MKTSLIYCLLLLLNACSFYGITNDFNKLSPDIKGNIETTQDFKNLEKTKIYEITGKNLLAQLKENEKSLVYIYSPYCKSKKCYPLFSFVNYAKENDYTFFLVMNSYSFLNKIDTSFQNYAIHSDYYKQANKSKYTQSFKNELNTSKNLIIEENIFLFKKDSLLKKTDDLFK